MGVQVKAEGVALKCGSVGQEGRCGTQVWEHRPRRTVWHTSVAAQAKAYGVAHKCGGAGQGVRCGTQVWGCRPRRTVWHTSVGAQANADGRDAKGFSRIGRSVRPIWNTPPTFPTLLSCSDMTPSDLGPASATPQPSRRFHPHHSTPLTPPTLLTCSGRAPSDVGPASATPRPSRHSQ
eukprot:357674-Chlamydomonas_euryale.AAC.1